LCQLKRWRNFDGYGFNLHISQLVAGQFIVGHVETQSPASAAGLQDGDHLIQVAFVFIVIVIIPIAYGNKWSKKFDERPHRTRRIFSDRRQRNVTSTPKIALFHGS